MSTAKNKRNVIVAVFILVGIAILVTLIMILGGQQKSFAKTVKVSAVFDDVSGLQKGNNVWLAGVKVGTVKNIKFNPGSKVVVELSILSDMQPYVHKDTKAKISSESLIGNKIVVLVGGNPQSPVIQPGDVLAIQTSINTEDMMNTLQQNNKNLLAITSDLKEVSGRLTSGQGSLGKLLHDETLVNTLELTMSTLTKAATNARSFTEDLSDYTAKLQAKGSLTNELVTDTVVFSQLRNTAIQFQQIAQSGKAVIDNLDKATSNIDKATSGLNGTSSPAGVLLNDDKAAADLKMTLNNLNMGSQKLNDNLEAMQHNFLLRGFFRKRAKAAADSASHR